MNERIGWIGTGVMGGPMCSRVIKAGYTVAVYNRTKEKAQNLIALGAKWCDTSKEVAENSDVVFTIVGFPNDVKEVYFSKKGILMGINSGSIIVDMTTSEPKLAQQIASKAKEKNVIALDAPVSGGDIGAKKGKLAIMVGGPKSAYEQILPLFRLMGENIAYMGSAGAGQHTKMCNQILIASTMIGVVESLLYAYKSGLDLDEVIDVIGKGAASCWSINNLGRRITKDDFDPGFFIKHFVKDMGIALQEAREMKLALPGLALAYQFYISAMALGLENLGTQGLYKVLAQINGVGV